MPDPAPLTGRRAYVAGETADPAMRYAGQLLSWLGAEVAAHGEDADVVVGDSEPPMQADEDWARSGAMALTGPAEGPPRPAPGAPASAVRGALRVFDALTRARGVEPRPLPGVQLLGERAAIAGLTRQGPRSVGGAYRPIRAADGWVGLSLPRPADVETVPALVDCDVDDDVWTAVTGWAATRTATEVADRAQLLGLAAARIPSRGERTSSDATPFGFMLGPTRRRRTPPLVIDLTSLWAGPLCAHLLGLARMRVVKVESLGRPDGGRSGPAAFFHLLHAGHESVALDFNSATGRAELAELVAAADVVLEASRPRALMQLGIDAEGAVADGAIWTSITAYGRGGPWSNRIGFGDDVAAAGGLVAVEDGVPMPCGDAIADPLSGVHAAVATAAALLSDHAYLVDVSMRDVAAAAVALDVPPPRALDACPPRARRPAGPAASLGAHTEHVLAELGIR